jgi:APA family basic amino acid/polyamine antiporter
VWLVAPVSILSCGILMLGLTVENWVRFVVWLAIGLVIYFAYSRHRSTLSLAAREPR